MIEETHNTKSQTNNHQPTMDSHGEHQPHILTFPFPAQGHINPNLQFCKRLVAKGIKVTLITTISIRDTMQQPDCVCDNTGIDTIFMSDGFDDAKKVAIQIAEDIDTYMKLFETNVKRSFIEFLETAREWECPLKVVVYDLNLTWVQNVLDQFGLHGAAYCTQSASVANLFNLANEGVVKIPVEGQLSLPGMPLLESKDVPSFLRDVTGYPIILKASLSQFDDISRAKWVLMNTFDQLEAEVVKSLPSQWRVMTTGPTTPSMFLDKRLKTDEDYSLHLLKVDGSGTTTAWLDAKSEGSVLYISFGSLANLSEEQAQELVYALETCNHPFIWVVREPERKKLPTDFMENLSPNNGLILPWCSQLDILSHSSIGCFITHCGWNSVLEALSVGVPMVAMAQWADQPTNGKYVSDVWKVGVRVGANGSSEVAGSDEIKRCISEVMDEGVKRSEVRRNAAKWKKQSIAAMAEGGSSDENINKFVADILSIDS